MLVLRTSKTEESLPRYLPRKGTETQPLSDIPLFCCRNFATIFTPQGDGNAKFSAQDCFHCAILCHDIYPARGRKRKPSKPLRTLYFGFATIFTPQGDGNSSSSSPFRFISRSPLPRYLPRKGTETADRCVSREPLTGLCHDIYPARGRKLGDFVFECRQILFSFATIFTPQGDGNSVGYGGHLRRLCALPRYLPRKGTET